jgi:hypothetical protein
MVLGFFLRIRPAQYSTVCLLASQLNWELPMKFELAGLLRRVRVVYGLTGGGHQRTPVVGDKHGRGRGREAVIRIMGSIDEVSAHCIALHRIASHRIASHRIASHRIASHRIASHRIASHRIASHCIAL